MFDPEAKEEVARVAAEKTCTFVIEWREQPQNDLFDLAASKQERLDRLLTFFHAAKAPLVNQLAAAGVAVTDLPTSSQLVATAPARTWRALLPQLEGNPNVVVLPNRMYTAV